MGNTPADQASLASNVALGPLWSAVLGQNDLVQKVPVSNISFPENSEKCQIL
jgi:hypothetical protein